MKKTLILNSLGFLTRMHVSMAARRRGCGILTAVVSSLVVCSVSVSPSGPTPSPTPFPTSSLSPPDGAVYQVGEPIFIDQEFTDGCAGGQPGDFFDTPPRIIALISPEPVRDILLAELTPETVRINLPGTYRIIRACSNTALEGETLVNTITVESACPLLDPVPVPPASGTVGPKIFAYPDAGTSTSGALQVLTLDNSFNRLYYLVIENRGDSDLVIANMFLWLEFDSLLIEPVDFKPYSVIRPGHKLFFDFEATILNSAVFDSLNMINFNLYIKSNDSQDPVYRVNFTQLHTYATQSSIPNHVVFPNFAPDNPATPDCADGNSDGVVDAADVANFLVKR
ncbi:MAG: hypothetical protein ABI579_03930 [Candidatus Sumerlaeota bacterium]